MMATDDIGQDILSILRVFGNGRMVGQGVSTNDPPPSSDAARAQSDPARYGMPPGGVPQPIRTRVVADPESTGSVRRPIAGSPPAAVPVASGAIPAATTGTPMPDYITSQPDYQAFVAQMNRRRAEQLQQEAIQSVFGGAGQLIGGLTGT